MNSRRRNRACGLTPSGIPPARACASNPTAFGSESTPPLARPKAKLSSTVLKLLAAAIGVRRSEIVVVEEKSWSERVDRRRSKAHTER